MDEKTTQTLRELRRFLEAYCGMPLPDWELVEASAKIHVFEEGENITRDIMGSRPLVFVKSGIVRMTMVVGGELRPTAYYEEGRMIVSIRTLQPSQILRLAGAGLDPIPIDLMSAVAGMDTEVLTALERTEVIALDYEVIEGLLAAHRAWSALLSTFLVAWLVHLQAERARLCFASDEDRYRFMVTYQPTLVSRVRQKELAQYMGLSEVGLSRIATRVRKGLSG